MTCPHRQPRVAGHVVWPFRGNAHRIGGYTTHRQCTLLPEVRLWPSRCAGNWSVLRVRRPVCAKGCVNRDRGRWTPV